MSEPIQPELLALVLWQNHSSSVPLKASRDLSTGLKVTAAPKRAPVKKEIHLTTGLESDLTQLGVICSWLKPAQVIVDKHGWMMKIHACMHFNMQLQADNFQTCNS